MNPVVSLGMEATKTQVIEGHPPGFSLRDGLYMVS